MDDEITSKIETIEFTLMKESVLGFDPSILFVLDATGQILLDR